MRSLEQKQCLLKVRHYNFLNFNCKNAAHSYLIICLIANATTAVPVIVRHVPGKTSGELNIKNATAFNEALGVLRVLSLHSKFGVDDDNDDDERNDDDITSDDEDDFPKKRKEQFFDTKLKMQEAVYKNFDEDIKAWLCEIERSGYKLVEKVIGIEECAKAVSI